jgi:hypothetical protein
VIDSITAAHDVSFLASESALRVDIGPSFELSIN